MPLLECNHDVSILTEDLELKSGRVYDDSLRISVPSLNKYDDNQYSHQLVLSTSSAPFQLLNILKYLEVNTPTLPNTIPSIS